MTFCAACVRECAVNTTLTKLGDHHFRHIRRVTLARPRRRATARRPILLRSQHHLTATTSARNPPRDPPTPDRRTYAHNQRDMDLAFFDPDSTHADHLRTALEAHVAADARRAAKYGVVSVATTASDDDVNHDDDCYLWPRGTTPDDVRAAYDDRLSAAMRELREATVESDEEDGDRVGVQPLPRAIAGKGWKGDLATPPSSGDEGEERVAVGGKRKRGCEEDAMLECEGGGAKRLRVDTDFTR